MEEGKTHIDLSKEIYIKGKYWTYWEYIKYLKTDYATQINDLLDAKVKWKIRDNLRHKVNLKGEYLPFYGDTTVLNLSEADKEYFLDLQNKLYEDSNYFVNPLEADTFHMTVHDLSNDIVLGSIRDRIIENQLKCLALFQKLNAYFEEKPEDASVKMRVERIYPGNNIALVVGLVPSGEIDFLRLMNVYALLEDVVPLPYLLRPHISLTYFYPKVLMPRLKRHLYEKLTKFGILEKEIQFDLRALEYQHFTDMNTYITKFTIGGL